MIIAIQHGLEDIKKELESRGNEVFYIGENRMADAACLRPRLMNLHGKP